MQCEKIRLPAPAGVLSYIYKLQAKLPVDLNVQIRYNNISKKRNFPPSLYV